MDINRWEPFGEAGGWFEDTRRRSLPNFDLAVDLYEENGDLVAKMHLPGVDAEHLDVSVEGDTLHITGSREETHEEGDKEFYRKEIRAGSFSRSVELPKPVDQDATTATYADGILTVIMPILEGQESQGKKVEVKTS